MSSLFISRCWGEKLGRVCLSPSLPGCKIDHQISSINISAQAHSPYIHIASKQMARNVVILKNLVAKSKYVRLKVEMGKMQTIKTSLRQLATRPLQLKARAVSWKSNSNFYSQRILNSQPSLTKIVDKYSNWIKLIIIFSI